MPWREHGALGGCELMEQGAWGSWLTRQTLSAVQRLSVREWLNKLCFHRSGMHMLKNQHSCFSCCKRFLPVKADWMATVLFFPARGLIQYILLISQSPKKTTRRNRPKTQLRREFFASPGSRLLNCKKILPTFDCTESLVVCFKNINMC